VGVARSDPEAVLATPVLTLSRDSATLQRIATLVTKFGAVGVFVGLPRSLSGGHGPAASAAEEFAARLAQQLSGRTPSVSVRLIDERFTTVSAERVLRESGRNRTRRRAVVDQAAAVMILQHALDSERLTGRPAGKEVRPP
jgi:putative holliday junction resolvase